MEETGQVLRDTICVGASDHLACHLTPSWGWAEVSYEWNPEVNVKAESCPRLPKKIHLSSA
jgi:hypothetical protein